MESGELLGLLDDNPVIAAVKNAASLARCLESDSHVVFVLYGNIMTLPEIVTRIKASGKVAMVHVDLIDGLAPGDVAIEFIARNTQADGVISTKYNMLKHAQFCGLLTVQRFFVLDSIALQNIQRQFPLDAADMVEILPGVMPKVIRRLVNSTAKPIVAGGLIVDKEDVVGALSAGAIAISSTNKRVWFI